MARIAVLSISPGLSRSYAVMLVTPHLEIASGEQAQGQGRWTIPCTHGDCGGVWGHCYLHVTCSRQGTMYCEMVRDCGWTHPAVGHFWQTGKCWAQRKDWKIMGERSSVFLKDGQKEMRIAAVRNLKRITPWTALGVMSSSNLTQWHGCHGIQPFTAQGRGEQHARNSCREYMGLMGRGREERCSHTTQDLQTYASRLVDRLIFGWGRWTLEEKTEENTRQWRMKNRFPEGRAILSTWPAAHIRTEAHGNRKGQQTLWCCEHQSQDKNRLIWVKRMDLFYLLIISCYLYWLGLGNQEMLLFFKHYCIIMGY